MERVSIENLLNGEDIIDWLEGEPDQKVMFIKRLEVNKEVVVDTMSPEIKDPKKFDNYLKELRKNGLDVDKGDAEFGYKMPLPEKGDNYRVLVIFRRHEGR